jgi:glycosyltransferase involved in cell wall biosynthesis
MKFTLLILTINELDGMKIVMPKIRKDWIDEIIVIDGGSTDGTIEWAADNGYKVIHQSRPGFGTAIIEGVAKAKGDIIITFSPDGNSMPERIPDLMAKMREGYDIVVVSRYLDWAKSEDDDVVTAFGNWLFIKMYNIIFGQCVTDYLVMFRGFRKSLIGELQITDKAVCQSQLMCRAARAGKRLGEIPGDEPKRIGGEKKMSPIRNGLAELKMLLMEYFR